MDWLAQVGTMAGMEWISVDERLPEAGVGVLIWSPIDSQFRRACVAAMDRVNGQNLWTSEYGDEMPTHWMPLPEPPKVT